MATYESRKYAIIPINADQIADGSVSNTEFQTVDTSSSINTQLGTKVPLAGGTMTGTLAYGDNVKSTYGTGADLEIFHDSNNSIIKNGTGTLKFLEDTKMVSGAESKTGNYEVYIALELVSTRIHSESKKNLDPIKMMNLNIADNGGAGAIVIGDKIKNLDKIDLDSIQVEINLNGNITEPFFKGEKRAGPIEAIKCIINEFKDNPVTFKKGDWFMTGSVIQPFKVNKGDKLKVDFRTLGKINVDFI